MLIQYKLLYIVKPKSSCFEPNNLYDATFTVNAILISFSLDIDMHPLNKCI